MTRTAGAKNRVQSLQFCVMMENRSQWEAYGTAAG